MPKDTPRRYHYGLSAGPTLRGSPRRLTRAAKMDAVLKGSLARRFAALAGALAVLPLAAAVLSWNQAGIGAAAAFVTLYRPRPLYLLPPIIAWLRPGPAGGTTINPNLTLACSGPGCLAALWRGVWREPAR